MAGTVIRDAHYPGRAPIDAYGNGGFRFAEMSHRGGLMMVPSGIYGWKAPDDPKDLRASDLTRIFEEADQIEILLVGMGADLVPFHPDLRKAFVEASVRADPMATGAAVRTYNVLIAEDRAVGAVLFPV